MAVRRRHSTPRSATVEEIRAFSDDSPSPSLAAQAIRASAAHRDSSLSSAYDDAAFSSFSDPDRQKNSQDSNIYEYTSMKNLYQSKDSRQGFWGVLARKAKGILEDNNASQNLEDFGSHSQTLNSAGSTVQSRWSHDNLKAEGHKGPEAIAHSLREFGGTIKNAFEEGLSMVEHKTANIIEETRKLQMRKKAGISDTWNQYTNRSGQSFQKQPEYETQLKASRDVANAMAAKAKLLLRELKTVKADLAFAKERSRQVEDENKILKENRQKGANPADDDLISLQLETLITEKARLAQENSAYARENRFLREIVEYHHLTMQDVVYLDEQDIEEVIEEVDDEVERMSLSSPTSIRLSPMFTRSRSPTPKPKLSPSPSTSYTTATPGSPQSPC